MADVNDVIREAREALGDDYDSFTLAGYAVPRLSADQLDTLVAEALWARSLGISSAGRYAARSVRKPASTLNLSRSPVSTRT